MSLHTSARLIVIIGFHLEGGFEASHLSLALIVYI